MYENSFTFRKMLVAWRKPIPFSGRSTRTELLGYLITFWLITTLFSWTAIVLGAAGIASVSFEPHPFITIDVFKVLIWLPLPALAVRRFHDQDKAGWWALPLILATVMSWVSAWNLISWPIRIMLEAVYIVALVLLFWKPTEGANRFGPDPRLDPEDTELAIH